MPIDLGLSRVISLLAKLGSPQLAQNYIHIAGTNGKGSVCAYLTSIIQCTTTNAFKVGKFTSPHLIQRHDCITLDNLPVRWDLFHKVEEEVLLLNKEFDVGCTEFEILTIVAFKIFELEKVDLAVLEVGLGGRLDATNVVPGVQLGSEDKFVEKGVIVTGMTKIGKDHENLLGNTLPEIAFQKAGIIKPGIPNVVDGSNDPEVLRVVSEQAHKNGSKNFEVLAKSNKIETPWGSVPRDSSPLKGGYQLQNLSVALKIMEFVFPFLEKSYSSKLKFSYVNLVKGIQSTVWPGRLQSLELKYSSVKPSLSILLDGAHNGQSARELRNYLSATYGEEPLTFVVALTKGKDMDEVFRELCLKPRDKVIVTTFGAVDGMPWIQPNAPENIRENLLQYTTDIVTENDLIKVFELLAGQENIVVCGSLYLVGEVLKLHNRHNDV